MSYARTTAFWVLVTAAACLGGCDDSESRTPQLDAGSAAGDAAGADVVDASAPLDASTEASPLADTGAPFDTLAEAAGDVLLVTCSPGAIACDGSDMTVCSSDGSTLRRIACGNGCDNTLPTPACKPASLNTGWTLYSYNPTDDSMKIQPKYVFENDGLIAVQSANALPSAYVNDIVLENTVVTGRFSVETSSDDDYIGFVLDRKSVV